MKFRHMHIAELLTTIHAEYKEFLEKHKESAALGKAGQDVKTMAEGLRGMPKFQEQTARYSLHIHVGGELVAAPGIPPPLFCRMFAPGDVSNIRHNFRIVSYV